MRKWSSVFPVSVFLLMGIIVFFSCRREGSDNESNKKDSLHYLNLSASAKYVGMETCAACHGNKHETFLHTGMGQSFAPATRRKSVAKFSAHSPVYDKDLDLYYQPFWDADTLKIMEFRMEGNDTVHKFLQRIDYVVGSGQHTNSHLFLSGSYLFQAPLTWYAQKQKWDLPPGFEMGSNTRFSRKIGLECMTCHNSLPGFVEGSENKYSAIPGGISCERCHGPGSVHVEQKKAGMIVDTSKAIDYSIVNPRKLPLDLQFDICQRCHLQGNAVLKDNKSFFDFKPGMKLSEVMTVFLPRYKNDEENFIMASHADRLKMSKCFLSANKDKGDLPYNNSGLTCITCHNPHVSVKETGKEVFNKACLNCHLAPDKKDRCSEKISVRMKLKNDCVSCHMPPSGSVDIPHVSIHDHFIRKPLQKKQVEKVRTYIGLMAVNEKYPSRKTRLEAYLNQYEKFDRQPHQLDSARRYIELMEADKQNDILDLKIRYYHLKNDNLSIMQLVNRTGPDLLLQKRLSIKSMDNKDAWTCYRIGDAFYQSGDHINALKFFERAVSLAPLNAEFLNKKAASLLALHQTQQAEKLYSEIIKEHPNFAPAYSNLAFLQMQKGNQKSAMDLLDYSLKLDPDYELAVFNKVSLLIQLNKEKEALTLLSRFAARFPSNQKAKEAIKSIKAMKL